MGTSNRLSVLAVARKRTPGRYADGAGLYLQVGLKGGKSWLFRYMLDGRARAMGLGPLDLVPLADARDRAREARRLLLDRRDPLEARREQRAQERLETARALTFDQCAAAYIEARENIWKNAKHRQQWGNTLTTYASPVLGAVPVGQIDTPLIMQVLAPIWTAKPETAYRVRGRVAAVLDWARASGYRSGDNPARWSGHLSRLLAPMATGDHHPSLPYAEVPGFMEDLRRCEGIAALALEFTILCAVRTGDVIGRARDSKAPMLWDHLEGGIWTIPSTKTGSEHRVPLSDPALALIRKVQALNLGDVVFAMTPGKPISHTAMADLIKRMNADRARSGASRYVDAKQDGRDVVVHGFRATFKTWAEERTSFPNAVIEAALAHIKGDKVEAAYMRGDLLENRRRLMADWAKYCASTQGASATVIPIRVNQPI